MKVLVIGGVAAGMSMASKLKRERDDVLITVYEKGNDLSYGACGMPYYLSDEIESASMLIARTKEEFEENGIHVKTRHEVVKVNAKAKTIEAKDLETGKTVHDSYDKLVVATGAHAIRLPIEGKDLQGIHVLNSLEDARKLKVALKSDEVKTVGVIGAGFIGIELAEVLRTMGKNVVLIERESQVLPQFDEGIAAHVEATLEKHHVQIVLSDGVKSYHGKTKVEEIETEQDRFAVDLVIEAIGILPNTKFLESTGIKRIKNGAIVVNQKMETSLDDVYAAGDCATLYHRLKESHEAYIALGTHANKTGRVIANQLCGEDVSFDGAIGSTVLKVIDLEVAKTGLTEKEAKQDELNYGTVFIKAKDHAGYYPGATPVHIKLVYSKDTCQLLGAQMVGKKGVAHRINIMAVAITMGLTAEAFSMLDLAYAPPFNSVWDPLQIATNQIKCKKKEC